MIERDDRGDGRRSRGTADEYDGEPMFGFPKDEVLAVACAAPENWRELADAARLAECLWRGREKNNGRSKMWQPNRSSSVRALVRVEKGNRKPQRESERVSRIRRRVRAAR